jgi:peptidyl-prolyl cis-trans isomerase A (cyclophilin A)
VASFVGLAEGKFQNSGKPYFDGLSFHRVEPNFVIQGGDPLGNGTGGPGYQFPNEIDPSLSFNAAGILAMANAGPDTNGSQFFITLGAAPHLNGGYTIFGRVASGMDSVRIIRKGELMASVRIVRRGGAASAFSMDKAAFDAAILARQDKAKQEARAVVEAQMTRVKARLGALSANADGSLYKILKPGSGVRRRLRAARYRCSIRLATQTAPYLTRARAATMSLSASAWGSAKWWPASTRRRRP